MFKRVTPHMDTKEQTENAEGPRDTLSFTFEGRELRAEAGVIVAAALLEQGVGTFRHTAVTGAPRGPLCMMGVCYECLVVIDGEPNQQACRIALREGMRIERQKGAATVTDEPTEAVARTSGSGA
jgi:predicted molibdopterin-dependent oxidoreductase YjgC